MAWSTPFRRAQLPFVLIAIAALSIATAPSPASAATTSLAEPLASTVWLCRPGLTDNPCNQGLDGNPQTPGSAGSFTQRYPQGGQSETLDATRVDTSGATTLEHFAAPSNPPVDCFYVYPTVDLTANPIVQVGAIPPSPQDTEMAVALAQAARVSGLCRMFVPVYRQAPLTSVAVGVITGTSADFTTGAMDVENAWNDYWNNYNVDPTTHQRRGVIILGHSQGSVDLITMIQRQIDGHADQQNHLVSAILLGGNVQVPIGQSSGGGSDTAATFQHLPACRRTSPGAAIPTGCVVAYSSYDQTGDQPPASNALFGRNTAPDHQILCVNPATLLNGTAPDTAQPLDAYLPTSQLVAGNVVNPNGNLAVVLLGFSLPNYPTGFAHYPDALTGQCQFRQDSAGNASWLQITGGDTLFPASSHTSGLGLHVVDYNVALGDLVELAGRQSQTWLAARR
jgi:hypothetical protein